MKEKEENKMPGNTSAEELWNRMKRLEKINSELFGMVLWQSSYIRQLEESQKVKRVDIYGR